MYVLWLVINRLFVVKTKMGFFFGDNLVPVNLDQHGKDWTVIPTCGLMTGRCNSNTHTQSEWKARVPTLSQLPFVCLPQQNCCHSCATPCMGHVVMSVCPHTRCMTRSGVRSASRYNPLQRSSQINTKWIHSSRDLVSGFMSFCTSPFLSVV